MTLSKQSQLDRIAGDIRNCRRCKEGKTGAAVPGEGNPDARIIFVGEAPGKTEAKTGRPFVGRSGSYLRSLIRGIGLREEDVYITSPVKYLPLRGTPGRQDIEHGRIHLDAQIAVICPDIIVLLGSVACRAVLGAPQPVMARHGNVITQDGRRYMITLHPAAVLRFPKYAPLVEGDFRTLAAIISGRRPVKGVYS